MSKKYSVYHDILGMSTCVTAVAIEPIKNEWDFDDFKIITTLHSPSKENPPMEFSLLEASLLAQHMDRELQARVRAEHPGEDWKDWLANYGYWYADESIAQEL